MMKSRKPIDSHSLRAKPRTLGKLIVVFNRRGLFLITLNYIEIKNEKYDVFFFYGILSDIPV